MPNLYKGRENALVYFLEGDEKHDVAKEALSPIAWIVAHHMSALAETENNPEYRKRAAEIINLLFDDKEKDDFIRKIYNSLI